MAAKWLLFRQNVSRFGLVFQREKSEQFSKVYIPLSLSRWTRAVRNAASSAAPAVSDADETVEFPQAADSHLTPSILDDEQINKFVNYMMYDGKKSLSQNILKEAFEVIKEKKLEEKRTSPSPDSVETNPLTIFHKALENSKPVVGVIPMGKSGKVFQVPTPLTPTRQRFLAMKWLISAARNQPGSKNTRMKNNLAKELLDAYENEGTVIKRKRELHKRAEANRAFAHYRWW